MLFVWRWIHSAPSKKWGTVKPIPSTGNPRAAIRSRNALAPATIPPTSRLRAGARGGGNGAAGAPPPRLVDQSQLSVRAPDVDADGVWAHLAGPLRSRN